MPSLNSGGVTLVLVPSVYLWSSAVMPGDIIIIIASGVEDAWLSMLMRGTTFLPAVPGSLLMYLEPV